MDSGNHKREEKYDPEEQEKRNKAAEARRQKRELEEKKRYDELTADTALKKIKLTMMYNVIQRLETDKTEVWDELKLTFKEKEENEKAERVFELLERDMSIRGSMEEQESEFIKHYLNY